MDFAAPEFQANLQIAIDLFVSKKRHGVTRGGGLRFKDSSGNLVFRVERQSHKSALKRVLFDASGNPLIYIHRNQNGSWQGFKRDNSEEVMIFRVERTLNALFRTELEVFPVSENGEESKSDFKMKGSPFHRSCTIYSGNSIMAQTSLMYKLGIQKVLVPRHRFRLTIFPGFVDHAFVVALIVIFFDGRKLWI
ncbi:Protein LURP-one-related 7 [Camellia lanceoleosa]|uniref:Protein LURP-one-related 7 n=1 Tax=Camellia lanceoleosa TaxID=1840588 RepID=A0ACC0F715_9ERIC|nr:Protein LURP-one-related 7 [Camellia lanceoleosa]